MRMNSTNTTILFILASTLLFSGFILQWYVGGKIDGYEYILEQNGLSEYDKGMFTGSLTWWVIQRAQVYNPISDVLISAGIITYLFSGLSKWKEILQNKNRKQIYEFKKNINLQNNNISDKKPEIEILKSKILRYEKKLALSNSQINNLKENLELMTKIINDSRTKPAVISSS